VAVTSCKKCGRQLAASARWCPDCGTPLGRTVRCRSCGNEIPVYGRGCHHCGARGAAAYGPITYLIFLGGVLIILLFVGLFAYFSNRSMERQKQELERQMERDHQEWRKQHGFDR
jgi:hypothetical protein